MFEVKIDKITSEKSGIYCQTHNRWVPLDPTNRHYQEVLDAIIEHGSDCFEGDIPADLQAAADAKLFAQQVADYTKAQDRLSQYQLSVGIPDVTETQLHGTDSGEPIEVVVVIKEGIAALPATIQQITVNENEEEVTENIPNPLVVKDDAERAEAQAVIDATPQPVKDHVDGDESQENC